MQYESPIPLLIEAVPSQHDRLERLEADVETLRDGPGTDRSSRP